jgi:hypothetical protein
MTDRPRKDRLIQTRVPQDLESTLKDEARKRRLSVSHLIRNVLEDTFNLVDNVVVEVDRVVTDSVEMAKTFQRDAQRLAATARGQTAHRKSTNVPEPSGQAPDDPLVGGDAQMVAELVQEADATPAQREEADDALAGVYAWQELVVHRPAQCLKCTREITQGERAYLAQSDGGAPGRVWLCHECLTDINERSAK